MQRLSSQDASFLHLEDGVSHMHIGSIALFEGPAPPYDELVEHVLSKLPEVPRYRQCAHFLPLALGRPVWVDDPHFNLRYHLRRTALPEPGGDDELRLLVGRVMSQRLDRDKPLWEMWMVEGLSANRWALVSKVHHAIVDGVAGAELLSAILDEEREPSGDAAPGDWKPERQPSGPELAAGAVLERIASPFGGIRSVVGAPRQALELAAATAGGVMTLAGVVNPPPASSLNGPIGPHRRWDWARSELSDVKRIRDALGGTVNDVVLTAIAGGFRELLASRGESTQRDVRTLVPVSVRASGDREYNNRVSAIFANLPVGIEDPVERLAAMHEQMDQLKRSHSAVAGDVLVGLSGFAPAMLLSLGLRAASRMPQRSVQTVTTNVPGPQKTLYAAGRRMLEAFPYVPLAGRVRIGVAIFSYDGGLHFGVTGDWDQAPDIGVLCRGIETSMADLLAAAGPDDSGGPVRSARVRAAPAEPSRP